MMYLPKQFSVSDESETFDLMDRYSFATVISCADNTPLISHLPLVLDRGTRKLFGHMARANRHWKIMEKNPDVTILFHGPHTYITPQWYVSGRDVPTWNYAVVHAVGKARLIEDHPGLIDLLENMSVKFEAGSTNPWKFELPDDLLDPEVLMKAIVGFEIEITELHSKFKLSQNRCLEDRESVMQGLSQRGDDQSRAVLEMMDATLQ
jgi:transcriptional regulator